MKMGGPIRNTVYILTDYKGHFGNKRLSRPYRSGMDLDLLTACFGRLGLCTEYLRFCDIDFRTMNFEGKLVLYTSSEDDRSLYKGYIEDICYGLTLQGACLIPPFHYIRAHNNKVFMEILRDIVNEGCMNTIKSHHYGCLEELAGQCPRHGGEVVLKGAEGAKSDNVHLAKKASEIVKKASVLSRSRDVFRDLWDLGRSLRHEGYVRESRNRRKFIIQNYIPGLKNDWKLLVFGNRVYSLYRSTGKDDFRASGSGIFAFDKNSVTDGMLDYAMEVYTVLDVPNVSLDIGYDGARFHLFEFQALYFGSFTLEQSPFFFIRNGDSWLPVHSPSVLEEVYAESVARYVERKYVNTETA